MRFVQASVLASLLLVASAVPAATPKLHRGPTAPRVLKAKPTSKAKAGATGISTERATQIQTALIKAGYMTGAPSGTWDAPTQAAMEKLQGDNGWQTKLVPDARAIIKLGLGSSTTTATVLTGSPNEQSEIPVVTSDATSEKQ